mgnify:CR=1 FL=1
MLQQYLSHIGRDIGLDSPDCSIKTLSSGHLLVSTTDFFYPIVPDPYQQGAVACCNVLSDLYALGITHCETILMVLAVSNQLQEPERGIVTSEMMKGFADIAKQAGTDVSGGQSIINPWPIIGGVGMSVVSESELIRSNSGAPGDKLILTKPIGTQIAANLYEWFYHKPEKYQALKTKPSEEEVNTVFEKAAAYMATLNLTGAKLMHKHKAKGATDITGFGLLGHTMNLASVQKEEVDLVIDTLPVLKGLAALDKQVRDFKLKEGFSAETSGGLLIMVPRESSQEFLEDFRKESGNEAWIVGEVVKGGRKAVISEEAKLLEV